MEQVSTGPIERTWDPDARLATIRFTRDTQATGKDAVVLVDALRVWIGHHHWPGRPSGTFDARTSRQDDG